MEENRKELAFLLVAYAMLMMASGVITGRQYKGIQVAFDNTNEADFLKVVNKIMAACNQAYEKKLKEMIDNKSLIVRP